MNCNCIQSTKTNNCNCASKKVNLKSKKNILIGVFSEYCTKTSVHGIGYLGEERSFAEKLWWILMFLFSVTICLYQITITWNKWNTNPVITSLSKNQIPIWQIPFPAVTVCPFNKIDRMKYKYKEMYWNKFNLSEEDASFFSDVSLLCNDVKSENEITNDNVLDYIRNVSILSNEIIDSATLNGRDIQFYNYITADGICFTYNSFNQEDMYTNNLNPDITFIEGNLKNEGWDTETGYSQTVTNFETYPNRTRDGVTSGMRITLRSWINKREYACGDPISGYKITLHNPSEYPLTSELYTLAPVNHYVTLQVEPNIVTTTNSLKNLPVNVRNCYYSNEKSLKFYKVYTQSNCEMECVTNVTKEICGCVAYYMPRDNKTKICGMSSCVNNVDGEILPEFKLVKNTNKIQEYKKAFEIYMDCNCLSTCASLSYDSETSQAKTEWYFEFISKTDLIKNPTPPDFYWFWYEYTYIDIFFKESKVMSLQRGELYGQTDFLADCGGLLGLFIGFSFLSFIELIYFFVIRLWFKIFQKDIPQKDIELDNINTSNT